MSVLGCIIIFLFGFWFGVLICTALTSFISGGKDIDERPIMDVDEMDKRS